MRAFVIVLVASSVVTSCKLRDVVAFEGEIEMTASATFIPPITTRLEMKGAKVRTESSGLVKLVSITDADAKKTWIIDDAAHTYSEIDLAKTKAPSAAKPSTPAKVTKRGSDTVLGKSCDIYEADDASSRVEVCVASGFSMLTLGLGSPFSAFAKGDEAWSEVLSHGFPLRIVMRDPSGAVLLKMEATRIEKKKLPDSDFAIPAGYAKTASPI